MHDLVIRFGRIVDGTGGPAFSGDIAINNGRITQVDGKVAAGKRRLNTGGALVAPVWVDIHTHYDGQITCDPYLSPSAAHGVTTVVKGNCGLGFGPEKASTWGWIMSHPDNST